MRLYQPERSNQLVAHGLNLSAGDADFGFGWFIQNQAAGPGILSKACEARSDTRPAKFSQQPSDRLLISTGFSGRGFTSRSLLGE